MRIRSAWFLLTMWGAACAALAQNPNSPAGTPPESHPPAEAHPGPQASGPAAASSPHQRDVTGKAAPEATPNRSSRPAGASSPHQRDVTRLAEAGGSAISSGTKVDDGSGQTLGTVADVVRNKSGQRYVVVSGSGGSATPVPYDIASSTIASGRIVLDRAAFEKAPKVAQGALARSSRWQRKVDQYWRKHGG